MKITSIHAQPFTIPLHTPFQTALRTADHLSSTLVTVETDEGISGYGEAPSTAAITGETADSIRCAAEEFIGPALSGMETAGMEALQSRLHTCIAGNSSAKAAVDMALYDLRARRLGMPLYLLLGGARREIETDITISVNGADEMARDSLAAVARGFRILKLKAGGAGETDLARIEAVRRAVGPDIALRVDANQCWKPKEAVAVIRAMEDRGLRVELVEQPVDARDLAGMRLVTAAVSTPILADESVFSPCDAIRVIQERAADMINIKLMKTGGIHRALQICAIAEACGVTCMMGCMLESRLAVSAAAHLAAAKAVITHVDLDGPALCRADPFCGGPRFAGNRILMPETPGLGTRPAADLPHGGS